MNNRQKLQLILAGIAAILLIFWLILPKWDIGKILGILSNVLLILGMLLSYLTEEKNKKKD